MYALNRIIQHHSGMPIIKIEEDNAALIVSGITATFLLMCLILLLCHRKRKYSHERQFTLNGRNIAQFEPTSKFSVTNKLCP